jgi:hypothetical protein
LTELVLEEEKGMLRKITTRTHVICGMLVGCMVFCMTRAASGARSPSRYDKPTAGADTRWVCEKHLDRVKQLFRRLDVSRSDMKAVQAAVTSKDYVKACEALLEHYRSCPQGKELRLQRVKRGSATDKTADARLSDSFYWHATTGVPPRKKDGRLDWSYCGPKKSAEWGYNLNRHYHIDQIREAYLETGNPRYINGIDDHLRDWIIGNPYPNRKSSKDRPQWRGLEVHHRLKVWAKVFYGFQNDPGLQPGTQILILSSIPEHADYLRRYHAQGGNWITMEMNALALAAAYWPEFNEAARWRDHAMAKMLGQLKAQTYPSGVQTELAMSYHMVAAGNMNAFADTAEANGWDLPPEFRQLLEKMYDYLARAARPDGGRVAGNDSTIGSPRDTRLRDGVLQEAKRYQRDDWVYILGNGKTGKKPAYPPSVVYPWAGHVIARNNWSRDAHWSVFDVGPWGSGHQHNDKLHISVYAHGRTLLVDGGPFTYRGGTPERRHAQGTESHNCILIDGRGQNTFEKTWDKPMTGNYAVSDEIVFARGTVKHGFRGVKGTAVHKRALVYVKDAFWIVVDRIETDRPRTISPLWHFHPDCTVEPQDKEVVSVDGGKGNLGIVPVGADFLKPTIVKGSTKPFQGWHSSGLGKKEPAPCAVYTGRIERSATFAWVLFPAQGDVRRVKAASLKPGEEDIRLSVDGIEVAVCLSGAKELRGPGGDTVTADVAVFAPGKKPVFVRTGSATR